jgi:hemerythrin-like domain-containing protein
MIFLETEIHRIVIPIEEAVDKVQLRNIINQKVNTISDYVLSEEQCGFVKESKALIACLNGAAHPATGSADEHIAYGLDETPVGNCEIY